MEESENVAKFKAAVSETMKVTHGLAAAHDALTVGEARKLRLQNVEDRLRTAALRIAQVSDGIELR